MENSIETDNPSGADENTEVEAKSPKKTSDSIEPFLDPGQRIGDIKGIYQCKLVLYLLSLDIILHKNYKNYNFIKM